MNITNSTKIALCILGTCVGMITANAVLSTPGSAEAATELATPSTMTETMAETVAESEPESAEEAKQEIKEEKKIAKKPVIRLYKDRDGIHLSINGEYIRNKFYVKDGKVYHFDENGSATIGWFESNGKLYYFGRDGASKNGWVFDDGRWYYLEGFKKYIGWHEIEDGSGETYSYCFDENGVMYEECMTPDGFYVNNNGQRIDLLADENKETFTWNKDTSELGTISGLEIAGHPAELYMLSTAGETSGFTNIRAVVAGDKGRAYGICQFDYRYDLVDFMNYAYAKHPNLWAGFEPYLGMRPGDPELVYNTGIGNAFIAALEADFETAVSDQLQRFTDLYWTETEAAMNAAGFNLGERHIAVSAAIFSINVNCGPQTGLYLERLSTEMTDEEIIRELYHLRNTVMANEHVGNAIKGTNTRYLSAEPQMALDLLYGYITIDSDISYGGGVEWHGNPFVPDISTIANLGSIRYATPSNAEEIKEESEGELFDDVDGPAFDEELNNHSKLQAGPGAQAQEETQGYVIYSAGMTYSSESIVDAGAETGIGVEETMQETLPDGMAVEAPQEGAVLEPETQVSTEGEETVEPLTQEPNVIGPAADISQSETYPQESEEINQ